MVEQNKIQTQCRLWTLRSLCCLSMMFRQDLKKKKSSLLFRKRNSSQHSGNSLSNHGHKQHVRANHVVEKWWRTLFPTCMPMTPLSGTRICWQEFSRWARPHDKTWSQMDAIKQQTFANCSNAMPPQSSPSSNIHRHQPRNSAPSPPPPLIKLQAAIPKKWYSCKHARKAWRRRFLSSSTADSGELSQTLLKPIGKQAYSTGRSGNSVLIKLPSTSLFASETLFALDKFTSSYNSRRAN